RNVFVRFEIVDDANAQVSLAAERVSPRAGAAIVAWLGEHLENESGVTNAARGEAGMRQPSNRVVRRLFAFEDASHVDQPIRTFVANDATAGGGQPARANRVCIERRITQTGGDRGGRST